VVTSDAKQDHEGDKTAWLLGSGFSKPLGGPLLSDLFRPERLEDISTLFPEGDYPGLAESLAWVKVYYNAGLTNAKPSQNYGRHIASGSKASVRPRIPSSASTTTGSLKQPPKLQMYTHFGSNRMAALQKTESQFSSFMEASTGGLALIPKKSPAYSWSISVWLRIKYFVRQKTT